MISTDTELRERIGAIRNTLDDLLTTVSDHDWWPTAGPNDCHYCYKPLEPDADTVVFGGGYAHTACNEDWYRREGLDPATNSPVGADIPFDELDSVLFVLGEAFPSRSSEIAHASEKLLSSRLGDERIDAYMRIKGLVSDLEPNNPLRPPFLILLGMASNITGTD